MTSKHFTDFLFKDVFFNFQSSFRFIEKLPRYYRVPVQLYRQCPITNIQYYNGTFVTTNKPVSIHSHTILHSRTIHSIYVYIHSFLYTLFRFSYVPNTSFFSVLCSNPGYNIIFRHHVLLSPLGCDISRGFSLLRLF